MFLWGGSCEWQDDRKGEMSCPAVASTKDVSERDFNMSHKVGLA